MLERTLRPPSRTAAAVSSHEVSMPSTIIRYGLASPRRACYWLDPVRAPRTRTVMPTRARQPLSSAWRNLARLGLRPGGAGAALVQDLQSLQEIQRSLELNVLLEHL